jgi:hypothetical protein
MTLFEQTLDSAAAERGRRLAAASLISRDDAVAESNPMGRMRWYLHPALGRPSTRALYFHELEIPAGGHSGRLQCQGGVIHYVLEGTGHTELDATTHYWAAGDVIALPVREAGITYRHVSTGPGPARLLVAWPNFDSALGPEAGVELKVIEPASDACQ